MNSVGDVGPSLPAWALYPTTLLLLLPFLYACYRSGSMVACFTIFVPWCRYILSAFHVITFVPIVGGFSINALASSGIFVLGLLIIRKRYLLHKYLLPFYAMMFVICCSGLLNHEIGGTIDVVVKFGYLVVLAISTYQSLITIGEHRLMRLLLWSFAPPLVFQVLSVALGVVKATEADGSISYIGGYNHEAAFSIVLATCFVVACLATGIKRYTRAIILVACLVGILLANYRTTIIAIAPLAVVQFNADIVSRFDRRIRPVLTIAAVVASLVLVGVAAWVLRERLGDLAVTLQDASRLVKRPEFYTPYERTLLSGRPFIWSMYIYSFMDGSMKQHLLGFGPESWQDVFPLYAHNTLVSTLYELGIVGVVTILFLWASMMIVSLQARRGSKAILVAAHISFFLLNMATMPHWMIEGDILYGIICGCTLYSCLRRVPEVQRRPRVGMSPIATPVARTSASRSSVNP
jgi:hypothetical protein